jgi:hypothetical protein
MFFSFIVFLREKDHTELSTRSMRINSQNMSGTLHHPGERKRSSKITERKERGLWKSQKGKKRASLEMTTNIFACKWGVGGSSRGYV